MLSHLLPEIKFSINTGTVLLFLFYHSYVFSLQQPDYTAVSDSLDHPVINSRDSLNDAVFSQIISLPRQTATVYSILNQISGRSGYYFVYETGLFNSDEKIRLGAGNRTLSSWIEEIIDDPSLEFRVIDNHLLVYRPEQDRIVAADAESGGPQEDYFMVRGRILDETTGRPMPYATIAIKGSPAGITTNSDGNFTLRVPGEYVDDYISVSHIGYKSQTLPVRVFFDNKVDILMRTDYFTIQEVIIRYNDPLFIVRSAIDKKEENYSDKPVYLLNFYREGVMRNNRFINYSEALFQTYKSSYNNQFQNDQVRLIQSRTISNTDRSDTLILKIRAGIRSALELDFIKNVPGFIDPEFMTDYKYSKADIIHFDGKRVYAVDFEQKEHIKDPLYTGTIYIDVESLAFIGAEFEVHPKYIDKAHNQFMARRNREFRASVEKAAYTVSYKYFDGLFYLNHVRADLDIRYRKRYQLFNRNFLVFVEMVTSKIDAGDAGRFRRRDALSTDKVFMDGEHLYDPEFWRGYSIITPEKDITDALSRIESSIESVIIE